MVRYSKKQVSEKLLKEKIVPVFYHPDIEICKKVVSACYHGGIKVFEYTNRGEMAIENFPILLEYVRNEFPDMILGIGSIINNTQATEFINLKADFIVSPILDKETGEVCAENDVYWIPGCGTLSEIANAENFGAEIIKIFPGSVLGSGFVKAVLGPMPWLKLMPTGGVEPTKDNLEKWFNSGVVCVGIGSKLIDPKLFNNPKELSDKIKKALLVIESICTY